MRGARVANPTIVQHRPVDELLAALRRPARRSDHLAARVREILARVRAAGDAALTELTLRYDRAEFVGEIPADRWRDACATIPADALEALERSCAALRCWHAACRPRPVRCSPRPGVLLERRPVPLRRVGVYAPGGRFAYASSVLMGVVPARAAGVAEVVVVSPPAADGQPAAAIAAACAVAGADRLFALGGAQAVAALAYGTETIPRVDKIVGPGNAWVQEAKRQVAGLVAVDLHAGPTEIAILADEAAEPRRLALELLAQAEHDPEALALLVSWRRPLLEDVAAFLLRERSRAAPAPCSGAGRPAGSDGTGAGAVWLVCTRDLHESIELLDRLAPEHLLVEVAEPARVLAHLRTPGTVIVGGSVALSDYATGANHILPTGGTGRFASGLGTEEFCRWLTVQFLQGPKWRRTRPDSRIWRSSRTTRLPRAQPRLAMIGRRAAWTLPPPAARPRRCQGSYTRRVRHARQRCGWTTTATCGDLHPGPWRCCGAPPVPTCSPTQAGAESRSGRRSLGSGVCRPGR